MEDFRFWYWQKVHWNMNNLGRTGNLTHIRRQILAHLAVRQSNICSFAIHFTVIKRPSFSFTRHCLWHRVHPTLFVYIYIYKYLFVIYYYIIHIFSFFQNVITKSLDIAMHIGLLFTTSFSTQNARFVHHVKIFPGAMTSFHLYLSTKGKLVGSGMPGIPRCISVFMTSLGAAIP